MNHWAERQEDGVNRGLLYGEGMFETLRIVDGIAPLYVYHEQRLAQTAIRLGFETMPSGWLASVLTDLDVHDGVVRLVVYRQEAQRGYAPCNAGALLYQAQAFDPPAKTGRALNLSIVRRASTDPLPGGKHLSRWGDVWAADQAHKLEVDDVLQVDDRGLLVEASSSNVIAQIDGRWITPRLTAGVRGAFRQYLLDYGYIDEATIPVGCLARATSIALVNAVRGIMPVVSVAYFKEYSVTELDRWTGSLELPW